MENLTLAADTRRGLGHILGGLLLSLLGLGVLGGGLLRGRGGLGGGLLCLLGGPDGLLALSLPHLRLLVPLRQNVGKRSANNGPLELLGPPGAFLGHILLNKISPGW
jgi:hypothetical protein